MSATGAGESDPGTRVRLAPHQPEPPVVASLASHRGKRPPRGEPVVDRALAVLGAFDEEHPRLSLTELARRAGLPVSTAHRLVERLLAGGALERAAGGGYVIGIRLWETGSLAPRARGLRDAALPVMEELQAVTRQHVLLAVREGASALLVARRSHREAVPLRYRTGSRLPLDRGGLGHVLLAHAPPELVRQVLHSAETAAADRQPDSSRFRRELAEVRAAGFAVVPEQALVPVLHLAAPVRGPDAAVVAALSAVAPAETADTRRLEAAVRAAAQVVSRALGAPQL